MTWTEKNPRYCVINDHSQPQDFLPFTCVIHVRTCSTLISIIVALLERV